MNKRILSTLLALCMMLALLPGTALAAQSGKCGANATWLLDGDTLTISGSGATDSYSDVGYLPWYNKKNTIKNIVVQEGITKIGSVLFGASENAVSVSIPRSVTTINAYAFAACKKLQTVNYAGTVDEWNEIAIDRANFPFLFSSTSKIRYGGSPSTSVIISGQCGKNVVWTLDSSGTLTVSGSGATDSYSEAGYLPWYYKRSNIKNIVVQEGITKIGSVLFGASENAVSVSIPRSVTAINAYALAACKNLQKIYYAGTVSEWSEISIDWSNNQWINGANTEIIYNSTGPSVTFKVTFDANSGSSTSSKLYKIGETLGTLPTPTRSGYTFSGWYTSATGGTRVTSSTQVTGDVRYYAHWTKSAATKTYTITLNANSGKVSPSSIKVSANKTYLSSLPTPTRSGYTFSGWYTSRTGGTKITSTTKATANRTIYAHWSKDTAPKTYLITFDPNGGSVFTRYAAVVNGGTYRSLPTPSYPGRHFAGWYTASSGGTKVTPQTKVSLTGNRTLYAHWTTSPVSVRSMESGSWRVTVPAGSRLALYGSETSAAQATSATISRDTALTCTRMAVLSNGTVRYYAKINSGSSYWFCYSDEMAVN